MNLQLIRPPPGNHSRHPRLRHRKLERITRHFDHVIDVNVILSVDKLQQKVEATCTCAARISSVECMDANMYAAIDGLVDKLDRQMLKHKEKSVDQRTKAGTSVPARASPVGCSRGRTSP